MKKILLATVALTICSQIYAQENAEIKIDEKANLRNKFELKHSAETFQFAIVADRTGGHRPGIFLDGIQKLNLLQPEFVMSVGDLIEGYTEDRSRLEMEWKEFHSFIDSLQMPFFYIPGNHDISNKVMEDKWKEQFGSTYFHFVYKDVLFLCLNSEDNYQEADQGTIDDEQYAYIEKTLQENNEVKWTLVFMHQPLWTHKDTKRWDDVEKLLEPRKHTVFAGHHHRYIKNERNNGKYFVLATTGGASSLRGPNFGEFDHVVWVTMKDDGPIIANLLLDGIWDENVMTKDLSEFVLPVARDFPATVDPVFVESQDFGEAIIPMKISNNENIPSKYALSLSSSKNILVDVIEKTGILEPNEEKKLALNLQSMDIKTLQQIEAIKMNVKVTYPLEGRKDLEIDKSFNVRPALKYKATSTNKSVKVDGNVKEWKDMDFAINQHSFHDGTPITHNGDKDGSAKFAVRFDDDFLYIGAQIIDDDIFVKKQNNPLYQDAIVVFIDPRPVSKAYPTSYDNVFKDWLILAVSPDSESSTYKKDELPEGTIYAIEKTSNGYDFEAAIPISYLADDWKSFRFNLMINDYDQLGNHKTKLSWKPIWTEDENYAGSGAFFK